MFPLHRQSATLPHSELTDELNSEFNWVGSSATAAFRDETLSLFGDDFTTLEGHQDFLTGPFFGDGFLSSPPSPPGEEGPIDFSVGVDAHDAPQTVRPQDLFDPPYQTIYTDPFHEDPDTSIPTDMYEASPPGPATLPITNLSTSVARFPTATLHARSFGYSAKTQNSPIDPPSHTSPSVSSHSFDSSESDGDGEYVSPSDDEYHPTEYQKRNLKLKSKAPRPPAFSPTSSASSGSGKSGTSVRNPRRSHPYKRITPPRNLQCGDAALLARTESEYRCFVCGYEQENRRIPDLRRHIETHDRWREPEKWICCGVGVDRAHLYGKGIKEGMTDEECIGAGASVFRGRLMIGGCMRTFSRRDALKRHVDNPKISCIGHMDSYGF